jgi:capsular polysaccharide transport system ATP-binding protein
LIVLHSVKKELGRGQSRKIVLDEIDLVIPPRTQLVILGQAGSGKTTLLRILSGTMVPTKGWVERQAVVSTVASLTRYGVARSTCRQLVHSLALLYQADAQEVCNFVERFVDLPGVMDISMNSLSARIRRKINLALFYGLPCDYYLFDNTTNTGVPGIKLACQRAFELRRKEAGVILATSLPRAAREFGGAGAVLFQGKIAMFDTLSEAIAVFEGLPPPRPEGITEKVRDNDQTEDEEELS